MEQSSWWRKGWYSCCTLVQVLFAAGWFLTSTYSNMGGRLSDLIKFRWILWSHPIWFLWLCTIKCSYFIPSIFNPIQPSYMLVWFIYKKVKFHKDINSNLRFRSLPSLMSKFLQLVVEVVPTITTKGKETRRVMRRRWEMLVKK